MREGKERKEGERESVFVCLVQEIGGRKQEDIASMSRKDEGEKAVNCETKRCTMVVLIVKDIEGRVFVLRQEWTRQV